MGQAPSKCARGRTRRGGSLTYKLALQRGECQVHRLRVYIYNQTTTRTVQSAHVTWPAAQVLHLFPALFKKRSFVSFAAFLISLPTQPVVEGQHAHEGD